jgi:chitinase
MKKSFSLLISITALVILLIAGVPSLAKTLGQGAPAWQPNTNYYQGSLVTYNGVTYQCIQTHQSQIGWEPPYVPALWGVYSGATPTTSGSTATKTRTPTPTNTGVVPSTPTRTNTSTSTPTSGGACSAPAYNNTAIYVANDVVSYGGHKWRAKWWTQGEAPSTGGSGVWEDQGPCSTGPTNTPIPTNTPTNTNTPVPTFQPPSITPGGPTATRTNTPLPSATPQPGGKRVVGYFAQWGIYQRNYLVKNIDTSGSAAKLTHINYAFGNIKDGDLTCYIETRAGYGDGWADFQKGFTAAESVDGVADAWDAKLSGNFNQLKKLKAKYPNLKVLISLGGWTWSKNFSDAALTAASRQKLVSSCINLYIKGDLPIYGGESEGGPGAAAGVFDGIDIDWEYPAAPGNTGNIYRPEDKQNFTLLLAEFRSQLNALTAQTGKPYLLTIAAPAGSDKYSQIELNQIHNYLDFINLMAYDYFGGFNPNGPTNFQARLYCDPADPTIGVAKTYCTDNAVTAYLGAGVPANKLVIGVPFYGRGWTGVTNANNGKYQSATGPAPAMTSYGEAGIEDYKNLKTLGYPSFRDSVTKAFWIYNGTNWWSYDDPTAITDKMNYIKSKGLGGAMAWELDGDDGTLLTAVASGLQ